VPTYAENAARRERDARRRRQDARDDALTARFEATKHEYRAKFERLSFAVVGEGSRTSQENYRHNYDRIFGPQAARACPVTGPAGKEAL
jgi:hypothetical protein